MKRILNIVFLLMSINMADSFAQGAKPMVAYRKGIEWYFYNTKNELLFPFNQWIAPQMVSAYFHGWCKVGLPAVKGDNIVIETGVIDEKGIEVPLKELTAEFQIVGITLQAGQKILYVSNRNFGNIANINQKGQLVPKVPLYYWHVLGDGLGAGYGKMPETAEEVEGLVYPMPGEKEMEYEVWDILNAKMLFKIKADSLGAATNGLLAVKQGGKWGFVNKKGQWEIKPTLFAIGAVKAVQVDWMDDEPVLAFQNGAIPAADANGKWGLINTKGAWLLKPDYINVAYANDGFWTLQREDELWIIANAKGKVLKGIEDFEMISVFGDLISYNSTENGWSVAKSNGKIIFTGADEAVLLLGDGYFMANKVEDKAVYSVIYNMEGKEINRIDRSMTLVTADKFSNGLIAVVVEQEGTQKMGYLNKQGSWAIAPGILPFTDDLPKAMDGFIHIWNGKAHVFYDHKGAIIREDSIEGGDWEMMTILQDENSGFWAPY